MSNHPNRCKRLKPSPSPELILAARQSADRTQTEAAEDVYTESRTWQRWEAGESEMHPAIYERFCDKHGLPY